MSFHQKDNAAKHCVNIDAVCSPLLPLCQFPSSAPPWGLMATKVSAEQLDAAAMSQFFQFLQCQLRLEAEEKLKQEVWLEDKDARVTCLQAM